MVSLTTVLRHLLNRKSRRLRLGQTDSRLFISSCLAILALPKQPQQGVLRDLTLTTRLPEQLCHLVFVAGRGDGALNYLHSQRAHVVY